MTAELSFPALLELLLGPHASGSEFADDDERETAYWTHREQVLETGQGGLPLRPWAWWEYEYAPETPPDDEQLATLARHGLLTEAEERRVLASDDGTCGARVAAAARAIRERAEDRA